LCLQCLPLGYLEKPLQEFLRQVRRQGMQLPQLLSMRLALLEQRGLQRRAEAPLPPRQLLPQHGEQYALHELLALQRFCAEAP
jgi:hypothetical protein